VCKKFSGRKFLESPLLEKRGSSEENQGGETGTESQARGLSTGCLLGNFIVVADNE